MRRLILALMIFLSLTGEVFSSTQSLLLRQTISQDVFLENVIDESYLAGLPPKAPYHQQLIIENTGHSPLLNFYPYVNETNLRDAQILRGLFKMGKASAFFPEALCYVRNPLTFLRWDNHSTARLNDILNDPLLVLRTKADEQYGPHDVVRAWENFSKFDPFAPAVDEVRRMEEFIADTISKKTDLYPGEKLIFHYNRQPDPICEFPISPNKYRIVEHHINFNQRLCLGRYVIKSGYPIYRILNSGNGNIEILEADQRRLIEPAQSYDSCPVYELQVALESPEEQHLVLFCLVAKSAFPLLEKGSNRFNLGTETNPTEICATYTLNPIYETEEITLTRPSLMNTESVFDHALPYFCLKTDSLEYENIWWQISNRPDFSVIHPNFEGIWEYQELISLDHLTASFFNSGEPYYFRFRVQLKEIWSEWSSPFEFQVFKPQAIKKVEFEKLSTKHFELKWEQQPDTLYLVFASNAFDFIPSIYFDKQINALESGEIKAYDRNDNLLFKTAESRIEIDDSYAFYRIVAERNGNYGIPSPIIHIWDQKLSFPRTVLQSDDRGSIRIPFPKPYPYWDEFCPDNLLRGIQSSSRGFFQTYTDLKKAVLDRYVIPQHVSQEVWDKVSPYFLPENHPIKAQLDRIFSAFRVTEHSQNVARADFDNNKPGQFSHTTVTTHPKLKGYLIKLYTDDQAIVDWQKWLRRIEGAQIIRDAVAAHGYKKYFKVPQKWIYPLPPEPAPINEKDRKNFILVAEDMQILKNGKNSKSWKNDMTPDRLDAFWTIVHGYGLSDSVYNFNVPFAKDGKQAFIDTEYYYRWPVPVDRTLRYLSTSMQKYWLKLIEQGGPK